MELWKVLFQVSIVEDSVNEGRFCKYSLIRWIYMFSGETCVAQSGQREQEKNKPHSNGNFMK